MYTGVKSPLQLWLHPEKHILKENEVAYPLSRHSSSGGDAM